jgi:Fe2+ or Zn2+ uptake regulation protein
MKRKTSIEAYTRIKENGLLSKRRWEVYEILYHNGPLTAHEVVAIARRTYPHANQTSFNARLTELEEVGVAETCGEKINPVSGFHNKLWDVNDKIPLKFEKEKRHKCISCSGKGYISEQQARLF